MTKKSFYCLLKLAVIISDEVQEDLRPRPGMQQAQVRAAVRWRATQPQDLQRPGQLHVPRLQASRGPEEEMHLAHHLAVPQGLTNQAGLRARRRQGVLEEGRGRCLRSPLHQDQVYWNLICFY